MRIWCIVVDTGTTRNDLESASRRHWERLSSDLRAEASSRLVAVMDFLSSITKELDKRPRTVEEIGLAYEAHSRIQKQSEGIAEEIQAVAGLARVLAAWTKERLDGVSSAHAAWEGLAERLEKHRSVIARQVEDTKVNLRHRGVALRDEIERWETKWSAKQEDATVEWVASMRQQWASFQEQKSLLKQDCELVGLSVNDILEETDEVVARLEAELEAEELNCKFQSEFLDELKKQEAEEWTVARRRLPRLYDWLDSWEAKISVHHQNKDDASRVDGYVGRKLKTIRGNIEWIQLLRSEELAEEHWSELKTMLKLNVTSLRDITLGHLLQSVRAIEDNVAAIKEIAKRAAAESGIRQALMEVETWEATTSLQLAESKDSRGSEITLVGEYGGLLARASELRLLLEGARGASGYDRFSSRAQRCETTLYEVEERVKILSGLQRKWIYLEPVYGSNSVAPNDTSRWLRADKEFRYLMGEIARDPSVPSLRRLPLASLLNSKDLLDRCQRSLDEFLEDKRSNYPRLYFLSDEDLLELVAGNDRGLQSHIPKLYQGVGHVIRNSNGNCIEAIVSVEGETLVLGKPVSLSDQLPKWLGNLEREIRNALRASLERCCADMSPDPTLYPAQVLLLTERIRFTEQCESALRGRTSFQNLIELLETQRSRYRGLEHDDDKLLSLKASGLLLDAVHHIHIARSLAKSTNNKEKLTWTWQRQLRFYKEVRCKKLYEKKSFYKKCIFCRKTTLSSDAWTPSFPIASSIRVQRSVWCAHH